MPDTPRTTSHARVLLLVIGLAGSVATQDFTPAQWQARLAKIAAIQDPAVAIAEVSRLEKVLEQLEDSTARVRLGELLVRAKVPRLKGMQQGVASMRALELFEKVLDAEPDNVRALYLHGRTCAAMPPFMNRRSDAMRSLAKLVSIEDRRPGSVPYPDVFTTLARLELAELERVLSVGRRAFPHDKALETLHDRLQGHGDSNSPPARKGETTPGKSKALFRNSLLRGKINYADLDSQLQADQLASPRDHEYPLFRGLLRLYQLEASPAPALADEAIRLFQTAGALNPDDTRIAGWLGPLLYSVGVTTGNIEHVREGQRIMDEGVRANPAQNLFGRAFGYRITGTKPEALQEDLYRTVEICVGRAVDRERFRGGHFTNNHPACGNSETAPHNLEGTMLFAAEFFASRSDRVRAEDALEAALRFSEGRQWPYRNLAAQRLRALRGQGNRPTAQPVSCLTCHQH